MDFGTMAKTIREQRGLTQVQLAERSALTVSGICQQAQGRRKHLLFESVVRLARALDVPTDDFAKCDEFRQKPQ